MRPAILFNLVAILSFVFYGCISPMGIMPGARSQLTQTKLDEVVHKDFQDLEIQDAMIKQEGTKRALPYVTYDEVWDGALIVLMQKGIIGRCDKNSGVIFCITTPPSALVIENADPPKAYLKIMDELFEYDKKYVFKPVLNPMVVLTPGMKKMEDVATAVEEKGVALKLSMSDKEKIATDLLDKVATQVYAGKKWKFLTAK
ncbi:MAG: hypothetical protein PHO01_11695 [Desulfotomaculaceae bacterium]|nr:hypothetical protein [Desulfotomaculaceae bacterium]